MPVYPSAIDLQRAPVPSGGRLAAHGSEIGSHWRRLTAGRKVLLVLARLRWGDTYSRLAAGSGSGSPPPTATYERRSRSWPHSRPASLTLCGLRPAWPS